MTVTTSKIRELMYMCPLTLVTPREGPLELGRGDPPHGKKARRERRQFYLSFAILQIVFTESQALNFV